MQVSCENTDYMSGLLALPPQAVKWAQILSYVNKRVLWCIILFLVSGVCLLQEVNVLMHLLSACSITCLLWHVPLQAHLESTWFTRGSRKQSKHYTSVETFRLNNNKSVWTSAVTHILQTEQINTWVLFLWKIPVVIIWLLLSVFMFPPEPACWCGLLIP